MGELLRRMRFLWRRDQFERELEEEMRHHLALAGEERGDAGDANRRFGNATLLKENSRAMWTWTFWEQLAQDIRYGARTMAANPLFTAMAVLSLALGIGANTAIYSFIDAILMRALPVRQAEELVAVKWHTKDFPEVAHSFSGANYRDARTGFTSGNLPFPALPLLRARTDLWSSVFAFYGIGRLTLAVHGQAENASGDLVSGNFYSSLGVLPAAGRLIEEDDDRAGAPPVAVISYQHWQRRWGGNTDAVGQPILINNSPFTVIGVSAPEFFGVDPASSPDVFIPIRAATFISAALLEARERYVDGNSYWVQIMGRLKPGVSIRQARAALAGPFGQFIASTASNQKERADLPALLLEEGGAGIDSLRRQYSKPLYVLIVMTGLILTIACANIANLLLARATARRREMAVRLSLGAGRWRVVRQLLTESVMLSCLGGALGILVAMSGMRFITWLLANGRDTFTLHASMDWMALSFTLGLALTAGILFGLAPALHATRVDLTPALKEARAGGQRRARHSGIRWSLSRVLVVAQIAITLFLAIAAGLFVRTLSNLGSIELGFNRENVLLFHLAAGQIGYRDLALARFYDDLRNRFASIPGVRSASLSDYALVSGNMAASGVRIPGGLPAGAGGGASVLNVGPGFFTTMQIPIRLGREIGPRDTAGSPLVAVVNENFTKKYFGNGNAIGKRFGLGGEGSKLSGLEIIGVAKNARYLSLKQDIPAIVYIPYSQNVGRLNQMVFELRTAGNPLAIANTVREIVHQADARAAISDLTTQADQILQTISQERTFADLCSCFAALALAISCVGLYGTMAYAVARRTSEIGIRMALGAERKRIVWMVLREVFALVAVGLAIGLGAAWGTTRFVESFLFAVKHHDPATLALSILVLILAAALAGYAPASRAARIDPMAALRHE